MPSWATSLGLTSLAGAVAPGADAAPSRPALEGFLSLSGNAKKIVVSAEAASVNIAATHPNAPITPCAIGANTNCPSDPPALIVPAAVDRCCGDSLRAVPPIKIEKLP